MHFAWYFVNTSSNIVISLFCTISNVCISINILYLWQQYASVVRYPQYLDTYRRYLRDDTSTAKVTIYRGIS